ncbi:MAG: hypothetical protein PVI41_02510, partial [Roseobacter sp.]
VDEFYRRSRSPCDTDAPEREGLSDRYHARTPRWNFLGPKVFGVLRRQQITQSDWPERPA